MWSGITYEACAWERDPDELALIPKSRRRKILPTYEAAAPASIASLPVEIPSPLAQRLAEVEVSLARFDTAQEARGYSLPALLVEQPVVDVAYVASHLGITDRAARNLVEVSCERGILAKMGNAKRGAFYQASDLIVVLEEASSLEGIRRIAAR